MWSRDHACCVKCGGTDRPHFGKGKCRRCYLSDYNRKNAAQVAALRLKWYEQNIKGTERQKVARERRNYDGKRDVVLARDGHKCVRCGRTKKLTVHHKDRSGRGSAQHNNALDNLETLCRRCHAAEHRRELLAARAAKKTTCIHGHPRTAEYGRHNGKQWVCRICANESAARYRERKSNRITGA